MFFSLQEIRVTCYECLCYEIRVVITILLTGDTCYVLNWLISDIVVAIVLEF